MTYELAYVSFFIYQAFYEIFIIFDIEIDTIIMMDISIAQLKKRVKTSVSCIAVLSTIFIDLYELVDKSC